MREGSGRPWIPTLAACAAILAGSGLLLTRCSNSPYRPGEAEGKTLFFGMNTPPAKLDPATSYYQHEGEIIDNIYEPPYEYHHLRRPYHLQPLAAEEVALPAYFDAAGNRLAGDPPVAQVARAEYVIRIRPGMLYADHPCFATNAQGGPLYTNVPARLAHGVNRPWDLPGRGTREIVAEDYVRGIRRLADPRLTCPIFSTIRRAVLGAAEYNEALARRIEAERARRKAAGGETDESRRPILIDYLADPCPGVETIDRYSFRLVLPRKYPQIRYWMAMHFFAPIPHEALAFYAEPAFVARQLDLNRWPVGSGPFVLREYEPNRRVVLERNTNYRGGAYPSDGAPGDREAGLLEDAGGRIPFLDRVVITVEREHIPRWNKFMQGYYDFAYVTPEAFEQTVSLSSTGDSGLSDAMVEKGVRLHLSVEAANYWIGFNMMDDTFGAYSPEKAKLRQAISIALDYNEFLEIFYNGQGLQAQGPVPPGIFGCVEGEAGVNPFTDVWDPVRHRAIRRPIDDARRLMAEAGFADGRGPDGRPLVLHLDHALGGDPAFVSVLDWLRTRLRLLGIEFGERGTELTRYREKLETGNFQSYRQGWLADYPDPENFLFLFYGPNSKVISKGENIPSYQNAEYDRLFEQVEGMMDGPERKAVIDRMVAILRRDAPIVWGFHPTFHILSHAWHHNGKPREMTHNFLKYHRVDGAQRAARQREWNRPVVWPVLAVEALLMLAVLPLVLRRPPSPGRPDRARRGVPLQGAGDGGCRSVGAGPGEGRPPC